MRDKWLNVMADVRGNGMSEVMSELGAIFPACRRCGRAIYAVPGDDGDTSHIERDAVTLDCEQRLSPAEEYAFIAEQIRSAFVRPPGIFGHHGMENRAAKFDRWLEQVQAESFHQGKNEGIRIAEESDRG